MAHIVNNRLMTTSTSQRQLTATDRKRATRKLERSSRRNPLRRIKLSCHGWVRDASAVVGDWVWCEECSDLREVHELAE